MNGHPDTPDAPQGQTHSPLPWRVGGNGAYIESGGDSDVIICEFDSIELTYRPTTEESDANAALIVHAVNTHAQLVAALELCACPQPCSVAGNGNRPCDRCAALAAATAQG